MLVQARARVCVCGPTAVYLRHFRFATLYFSPFLCMYNGCEFSMRVWLPACTSLSLGHAQQWLSTSRLPFLYPK